MTEPLPKTAAVGVARAELAMNAVEVAAVVMGSLPPLSTTENVYADPAVRPLTAQVCAVVCPVFAIWGQTAAPAGETLTT